MPRRQTVLAEGRLVGYVQTWVQSTSHPARGAEEAMMICRPVFLLALLLGLALVPSVRADDDDPAFRGKALSEWLQMLQSDDNPNHRQAAVIALHLIGPKKSRKIVPALVTVLREDQDAKVRVRAAGALRDITEKALRDKNKDIRLEPIRDTLASALRNDKSDAVREAAARALGVFEGEAISAVGTLALALKDRHAGTRAAAADALRRIGRDAGEALPELQQVLRDKTADRVTRIQCALAIGRIGPPDGVAALPALKEVLADSKANSEVRKAVAETLGHFGKDAGDGVATLGPVLTARDSPLALRRAAANALDAIGAHAGAALAALQEALKDEDRFVRSSSLHALGQLGSELGQHRKTVVRAVLVCLDDNAIEVRIMAIDTLASLGPDGLGDQLPGVVQRLTDTTQDPERVIRDAAKEALKKLKGG
jgi:HEAT repeat protein